MPTVTRKHDDILPYEGEAQVIEYANGFSIEVRLESDDTMDPPWENSDGHGEVSDWRSLESKKPGERVLVSDRGRARFYNVAESMRKARAEGWDAKPYKTGTKGQQAARAVEADFKFLQDWCEDRWHYVGIIVTLRAHGVELDSDSCWGYESIDEDHLNAEARSFAAALLAKHRHLHPCDHACAFHAKVPA